MTVRWMNEDSEESGKTGMEAMETDGRITPGEKEPPGIPMEPVYRHVPVMLAETLFHLQVRPGGRYVDATLGGAGHARAILEAGGPELRLVAFDRDAAAIENGRRLLSAYGDRVTLVHAPFSRLGATLESLGIASVDGILADLGLSTFHLEGSGRGFSFTRDEALDMRMDTREGWKASELLENLDAGELADIFFRYGEERHSRRIAEAIVRERRKAPIATSGRLARLVMAVAGPMGRPKGHGRAIHPATRVFMALRIAVNRELEEVADLVAQVPGVLAPGGRLCVITFHSLEDRIVKHMIRDFERDCDCPPLTPRCICGRVPVMRRIARKAIVPSEVEITANPPSRSAKLRVAERVNGSGEGTTRW